MALTLTYPGVHVTELASGSRTITGVGTSITAFVGRARRGPTGVAVAVGSWSEYEQTFGGLWLESGLGYAVRDYFRNGGSAAQIVRLDGGALTATLNAGGLPLQAYGPGSWGNDIKVKVTHPGSADSAELGEAAGSYFDLTVWEGPQAEPRALEQFNNVTVSDGPRRIDLVLEGSRLVRVSGELPDDRPGEAVYEVATPDFGDDGSELQADDYRANESGPGIDALRQVDLFNLLCLPPSSPQGDVPAEIWSEALALCTDRDAMLLVDPPALATIETLPTWVTDTAGLAGVQMRNAALYFPRLRQADPERGGAVGQFVGCGAVAGVMARTDATRGVWKAPAGIDAGLLGVSGLSVPLTDEQNGRLNPRGLNCLRSFRDAGSVVWGARTLRGADSLADEYRYVPVRRLALFLKGSLYRGTQWVVFEPNDAPLWGQIRLSVGAFMQDLFRQGAFQGSSPRDAYFVKCDAETTTQYDIDRGVVNIMVGFAPLKPAEFVVIGIQQKTSAATT
ncbi:phage tail sheath family protein [Catellatospora chokoriensis]|uniref:Tail protein n=1 Tax=Catellatospora chokoriensis TaxID=310353 RepID=A0A8J3JZZ8_9ACTN|nr:phage tail sheath subtilisin-like domain-containing protein [Catellatospora chokoriensis]GIF90391.1 tail protein [Catellatospora chokoriensis]